MSLHVDRLTLDASRAVRRGDGTLVVPAALTRAGVLTYHDRAGKPRRRLRHPDDVLSPDRIAALGGLPVTLDHPDGMVTPETAREVVVGTVDLSTYRDGDLAMGHLVLHDAVAIDAVLAGTHAEVSPGYWADVVNESGEWNGEPYDDRQVGQEWNHIALVPRGRSGARVRVMLDHDARRPIDAATGEPQPSAWTEVEMAETKAPQTDAQTLDALRAEVADLKAKLGEAVAARAAAAAVRDAATADADKRVADAKADADRRVAEAQKDADARAAKRARIVADHIAHVGSEPAADATIETMQRATIAKLSPDFALDGRGEAEIAAIYGYVIDRAAKARAGDAALRGALDRLPADAQPDTVADAAAHLIAAVRGKRGE